MLGTGAYGEEFRNPGGVWRYACRAAGFGADEGANAGESGGDGEGQGFDGEDAAAGFCGGGAAGTGGGCGEAPGVDGDGGGTACHLLSEGVGEAGTGRVGCECDQFVVGVSGVREFVLYDESGGELRLVSDAGESVFSLSVGGFLSEGFCRGGERAEVGAKMLFQRTICGSSSLFFTGRGRGSRGQEYDKIAAIYSEYVSLIVKKHYICTL